MMKKFAVLALVAMVPAANVLAQSSLDDEINAELDRMYSRSNKATTSGNAPSVQVNVQTNPVANANNSQSSDQKQTNDQAQKADAKADQKNDQAQGQSATSSAAAKQDTKAEQAQAVKTDAKTVVKNPTTVITATPLTESRLDQIRKARQELEIQSETRIAERLEQSRIEDEQRRAEALFGDRFKQMMNQGQTKVEQNNTAVVAAPVAQPAVQQQPVQPTIIVVPVQSLPAAPVKEEKKEEAVKPVEKVEAPKVEETVKAPVAAPKEEVAAPVVAAEVAAPVAVSSGSLATAKQEEEQTRVGYLGVGLGMGEYISAKNVRGNYSVAVAGGTKINDRILVDGAFSMANYDVEQFDSGPLGYDPLYPRITEMNQYALAGTAKYQLMTGSVRPSVGATIQYTYRTFSDKQLGFANNDATSHAVDFGAVIGVDFEMSKSMSIGLDYRYMFNLYNRAGSNAFQTRFATQVVQGSNPIEKFNYQTVSIMGRFSF